jgi:hypothetical protein
MTRRCTLAIAVTMALSTMAVPVAAQPAGGEGAPVASVREAMPNDFCIEILGRALLYNFSYQRMLNAHLGLEVSASALGSGSTSGDESETLLFGSLGGRLYVTRKEGSPFLTAGIVLASLSTNEGPFGDDSSTGSYGYLGPGLEYRARGGMLFRGTAYGLVAEGGFFVWPGLTVGYAW